MLAFTHHTPRPAVAPSSSSRPTTASSLSPRPNDVYRLPHPPLWPFRQFDTAIPTHTDPHPAGMFSQGHFRPLTNLPPQRSPSFPSNNTPSPSSALHTPAHTSPFDEGEDEFDLGDPHFNNSLSRSRSRSNNTGGGLATFVHPEETGGPLNSLNRSQEELGHGEQDKENSVSGRLLSRLQAQLAPRSIPPPSSSLHSHTGLPAPCRRAVLIGVTF